MINRDRKLKENKSIIIRTCIGNVENCYHFVTIGLFSEKRPKACQSYVTFDKVAERIEIKWDVGGDVFVYLVNKHPNGFEVIENVVFDAKIVTDIDIETFFD